MKNYFYKYRLILISFILVHCSDSDPKVTGGGSETEAGIQVAVIDSLNQPVPYALVKVYHPETIASALDSFECNQVGICHLTHLTAKTYLMRSDYEDLMSMQILDLSNTYDSSQTTSLNLTPPSHIEIKSFQLDTQDSIIRIGIAGFNQWDTISTSESWSSDDLPLGDHTLIIEGVEFESNSRISTSTIKLGNTPLSYPSNQSLMGLPKHILFENFHDRQRATDWSLREGLVNNLWQFQGEIELDGQSDSFNKDGDNSIQAFINLASDSVPWDQVSNYFADLDTQQVSGLIISAELDSTLLPELEPYLDLTTQFYSTLQQPFQQIDSVSLVLMTQGDEKFQILALDENRGTIDASERVGTQGKFTYTTFHLTANQDEVQHLVFRSYDETIIIGYIVVHTH